MHRRARRERTFFYRELTWICHVSVRYALWIVLATVLISVPAWREARRIGLDTDLTRLLPPHSRAVQWSEELEPAVGDGGYFSVIVEGATPEVRREAVREIAARLAELPAMESVDFRYPHEFLQQYRYALIPAHQLRQMRNVVAEWEEQVNPFLDDLGMGDGADEGDSSASNDTDRIEQLLQQYRALPEYHEDPDHTMNGMILHVAGGINNLGAVRDTYDEILGIADEVAAPRGITVSIGGSLRTRVEEFNVIIGDLRLTGIVAVLAILVTLAISFRSIVVLPVLVFPLAAGLVWAFAFVPWLVGDLNTITSFLLMVLFGMGVDYSIHLVKRFRHELVDKPLEPALIETFTSTGRSVATSGVTTAFAMAILAISDFRGFSDFGWIGGFSITMVTIAMLLLMPATLVLGYRLGLVRPRSPQLHSERLVPPKWLVATLSTLTLLSMVASGLMLRFDYDFANTSPSLVELEAIKEKERDIYPVFFGPQAIYVAHNLAALDDALALIEGSQEQDGSLINTVSSVRDFAPSRAKAAERLELIAEIQEMLSGRWVRRVEDPDRVRLIEDVLAFQAPALDQMPTMADLPSELLDPLVARDGSGELVLGVTATGNPKDGRITMEFTRELYELTMPETVRGPTGDKPVLAEVLWLVSSEGPLIIVLTFLGIFVLVIIDRRDVQQATWVLVPLVASLLLTFGVMLLLGWKVNFFNMVVLPSLLGLGVDHGVHYYRRWRELGCRTAETQLELFEPITVATLTTVMGYAGMALASHPGLRSIGNLAIVGLGCTWVTAMVLLPGLLSWREAHHSLDPDDDDESGPEDEAAEESGERGAGGPE